MAPTLRERARALDQSDHVDELVGAARRFLIAGDEEACQSALERAHRQALSRAQAAQVGNMIDNYTDQARTIERWRNDLSGLIPEFLADQLRSEGGYSERLHREVSRALAEAIRCGERPRALALFEAYRRDGEKSSGRSSLTVRADQRATQRYLEFVRADDDGWARAQIIARAEAFLEAPIWPWATDGPAASGRRLAEIRAHLAGGDRAERDGGDHLFGDLDLDQQRALPATSAAQALSFVRAMLRFPERYVDLADDPRKREWIGEIAVEQTALGELIAITLLFSSAPTAAPRGRPSSPARLMVPQGFPSATCRSPCDRWQQVGASCSCI